MARPTVVGPTRKTSWDAPVDLLSRLNATAVERAVSRNRLISYAVARYLDQLAPPDQALLAGDEPWDWSPGGS